MTAPRYIDNSGSQSLSDLPADLKRMLRIQFKEFIHFIEDNEVEMAERNSYKRLICAGQIVRSIYVA